jgi:hypothetical protein
MADNSYFYPYGKDYLKAGVFCEKKCQFRFTLKI